jgi:hypothetical protein
MNLRGLIGLHHANEPYSPDAEARLVGVLGRSEPKIERRDDGRLRGWVGPTQKMFGREWDKGHFIAHSIGGAVDGWELNVFVQRRELNRGGSEEGKRFREMEKYCVANHGTFCFQSSFLCRSNRQARICRVWTAQERRQILG